MPEIILTEDITGDAATKLVSCFSKGVIKVEEKGWCSIVKAIIATILTSLSRWAPPGRCGEPAQ